MRVRSAAVRPPAERTSVVSSSGLRPTAARNLGLIQRARLGAARESAAAYAETSAGSARPRPPRASRATRLVGRSNGAAFAARADESLAD